LAAYHPKLDLLGISTVHGTSSLNRTTVNAGSVLTAIDRSDIPVYPGAAKPFCRDVVAAADIHGESGLDGTSLLPKASSPPITDVNAILAMRAALLSQPKGTAWLVATGALTNLALLFATFPEMATHIKGLSIMGGAIGGGFTHAQVGHVKGERKRTERMGNITRWAESNIYRDPESAQCIFSNPILAAKTTLIPLDITHQVLGDPSVQQQLLHGPARPGSTLRPMLYDLLMFFAHTYSSKFGITVGPPVHDPVAVAVTLPLADGMDFDDRGGERWIVKVVTQGLHSDAEAEHERLGRTVATKALGSEGVTIPRTLDVPRFWAVMEDCVSRAAGGVPI